MIPMPMTTFGGDGQASALPIAVSEKPKMTEHNPNVEDVESVDEYKAKFGTYGSDGCLEEADSDKVAVGQFQFCELVDGDTPDLIGVLEEEGR